MSSVPFWTLSKIIALVIVVLVTVSSAWVGMYFLARPPGPSCGNYALNYPSCNVCSSSETYSSSTSACVCKNYWTVNGGGGGRRTVQAVNPPACDRFCANNAINPPGCDQCPDNQTDIPCAPAVPTERGENIETASLVPSTL